MRTLHVQVAEARSLVTGGEADTTFVEVGLRIPGERHKPKRSGSVREVSNPQWEDASFDFHIEGSGIDGDLEIRVFQGEIPNEVMVGETILGLQKLPVEGYDRKPIRLDKRKGIIRVTASLDNESSRETSGSQRLAKGMKVNAMYRNGNRSYPGTIMIVNRDGTCDIAYDDGEREASVKPSMITPSATPQRSSPQGSTRRGSEDDYDGGVNRLRERRENRNDRRDADYESDTSGGHGATSARARLRTNSPRAGGADEGRRRQGRRGSAEQFSRGDRVEARYRGRGSKFYKGKVFRVNSDGTLDIAYDDGEEEIGIAVEHVNSLEPTANSGGGGDRGGSRLQRGDRVEARYRGRGTKFYKGTVSRVNSDGTLDVDYDDGEKEIAIAREHVNSLEPAGNGGGGGGSTARRGKMVKGDRVEARYRGKGTRFYKGRISRVNSDDTFDIAYDDGEKEIGIAVEHVRSLESQSSARADGDRQGPETLLEGERVEARYKGRSRYYPGRITRVHRDGTCDIDYDDGERERMVDPSLIKPLETRNTQSRLEEGMKVEARYKGRSRYYPGRITRVHRDGTCDIDYDDGERERMVDASLVKSLEREKRIGRIEEGMKVEARYKGRSRYYPGRIARVHRDGTCDIDYDDGEKERGVATDLIRAQEPGERRADAGAGARGSRLQRGDRVEARYRGRGTKFYKGTVSRVNSDGTLDVDYDDGEKEIAIAREHVNSLEPAGNGGGGGGSTARRGKMVKGDRVEARYRGKGTRFYKGRISRVNSDDTFDIAYDDGEKEIGIAVEHVRSLESQSSARADGDRQGPETLLEGERVEARYKGRSRYYPGKITRVHRDGTYDIDYDDGESERMVEPSLVKAVRGSNEERTDGGRLEEGMRVEASEDDYDGGVNRLRERRENRNDRRDADYESDTSGGHGATSARARLRTNSPRAGGADEGRRRQGRRGSAEQFSRGDRVEARYRGRGSKFYKGKVFRVNSDGTLDIAYDDGEEEIGIAVEHVNSLEPTANSGGGGDRGGSRLQRGDRVEARYRGRGTKFYKGTVSRVNSDGTLDVDYDDGEKEIAIAREHVNSLEPAGNGGGGGGSTARRGKMVKGDRVEARYRGKGTRFYKGRISRVNSDDTFDIAYDDGEKEIGIAVEHVRSLESQSSARADGDRQGPETLLEGERVEARYKGRSRYYPGKITRVHRDGTYDIDYDDGESERMVEPSLVKAVRGSNEERTDGGRLEEGMRVEARYKGRSRYYPGRITRVHRDGTCDIDYDDGERERMVEPSLIKPFESHNSKIRLTEGMRVEARYKGRSRYYPGKITRVHRDGTCDIDYDDGEREREVEPSLVKAVGSNSPARAGDGRLEEGMKVEARYKGRGRYYPGRITRVHRDGTCDIDYDDGERERMVEPSLVKAVGGSSDKRAGDGLLEEGMKVEARYKGRSRYYPGRITRVHRDGTCDINYDDGERERMVDPSLVNQKSDRAEYSKQPDKHRRSDSVDIDAGLRDGDRVEANYQRRGRYYPGVVSRVRLDGSIDVDYDDGKKESRIAAVDIVKVETVLGRSESARFRRAFNRADTAGDGEVTTAGAARAYRSLGGTATENEVRDFLRATQHGNTSRSRSTGAHGSSHLDFPAFVKAYAWVFYRGGYAGDQSDDNEDESDEALSSSSDPTRRERGRWRTPRSTSRDGSRRGSSRNKVQRARKLGYGSTVRGSRDRSWGRGGIGEEAELRRWGKRLGEKQMRRLERVFDEWAVDDTDGGGGATVEAKDLERCFKELGKDGVQRHELRAWCDEVDLAPGDALSLADFAYAYHAMFVDAGGEDNLDKKSPFCSRASRVLAPAAGHGLVLSSQGAGRRLDGGLLSVAEVAASIFQSEEWEELDEDRDGEIPRKLVAKFLAKVGRDPKTCAAQITTFCQGGSPRNKSRDQRGQRGARRKPGVARGEEEEEREEKESNSGTAREGKKNRVAFASDDLSRAPAHSTASLAEILATFGFVFESTGAAVKPSVAEAFAMLRLHAQPAEARAAGEAAKRYVENVITAPGDARFWRINAHNDAFFAKLGRHKGGRELLAAVGFCDELRAEAGQRDSNVRKAARKGGSGAGERKEWLVLEGTVGSNGKSVKAVGAAQLKVLRAAREELDAELQALEGAPSVSAALRALRESPSSPDTPAPPSAVRTAAELLLAYVTNALRDPRNPRVHRVRFGNPAFQRALGRLGGCEAAMTAVGFEPRDRGAVFVLRELGAGAAGGRGSAAKEREEVATANFRFPALDPATEAFLWRRKADLEAAIEAMPATGATAAAAAPQSARGRAAADLEDSRMLADAAGAGPSAASAQTGTTVNIWKQRSSTTEPPSSQSRDILSRQLSSHRGKSESRINSRRNSRFKGRRASPRGGAMESVGMAAATALLAAADSRGSTAASGARGLQLAMIKEAFSRLDMDGDGFISPGDLGLAFRNMGRDASDRRGAVALANAGDGDSPLDDGASEVAAAFGRLRLSGSPAECRAAAEFALDYCRRVRDSPSSPLHWRIPLNSKRFSSTVGRLIGGVELMLAIGLRLEENGTVLALREVEEGREKTTRSGGKWERAPDSVLQRLDTAAKELSAQMRGIDHPEVADLAAVSGAVARLRDSNGNADSHLRCIQAAAKYLGNVLQNPTMGKYRVINTSNAVFLRDVVSVQGGVELMVALGFREDTDGQLILPMETDLTHLAARKLELDAGLSFLRAAAAAATATSANVTVADGIPKPPNKGTTQSASSRAIVPFSAKQRPHEALLQTTGGSSGDAGKEAVAAGKGRADESSGRTAVTQARLMREILGREVQSRRAAQAALGKREREVERLQGEVAAFKEKELFTLPIRDALTVARMEDSERASVAQLTSKMGLDMTNAAEALEWAENIKKQLALSADDGTAVQQRRGGRRSSSSATPTRGGHHRASSRPATAALGGATTRLLTAVTAGEAVVEVARPEIFRAGFKLVLGSGPTAGQEGRFVTAVVGSVETGGGGGVGGVRGLRDGEAGGGGYVVLEMPVKLDHAEGTRVASGWPGRVVSMVKNHLLHPIVDAAVRMGEEVLSSRAAQKAFERRSVHKYAFTVTPLYCAEASPTHISDGGRNGGNGRGIAVFPELGQVVSVSGKSTLVAHQESLSLQYLRRSFLRIGRRAAWGEISAVDFRTELLNNPILAASLTLPNGGDSESHGVQGDPGARALSEILGRRHRRHCGRRRSRKAGEELPDNGQEKHGKQQHQHQHQSAIATISWPEFVDAFIPLGEWDWDVAVGAEPQRATLMGGGATNQDQGRREAGEEHTREGVIVGEDEVQLLRVAFAATTVGASCSDGEAGAGAVVSIAELRAASALLDGVEPPEELVRKALGVVSNERPEGGRVPGGLEAEEHYSFRDFVLLRAVLAREVTSEAGDGSGVGGPGFASGWRLSALMHLRRIFVRTFDDESERGEDHKVSEEGTIALEETESFPRRATVGADSFVSRAVADPAVVYFLGMRPSAAGGAASGTGSCSGNSSNTGSNTSYLTLREALRELVGGASGSGANNTKPEPRKSRLRWQDIEVLLFRPYDPTEIFSNAPSTAPIGFPDVDPRSAQQQREEVYELATDTSANLLYALMTDGEVKVYDAAGPLGGGGGGGGRGATGGPLWTCQLVTHDPSPRSLGTETRGEYRRWRERVGLNDRSESGNDTTTTTIIPAEARFQCKAAARRLLGLQPRAKVLFPCPGTGVFLVNTSAGDRCIRFHETAALRRICRTRLDLPPPPRSCSTDGQGLFDVIMLKGEVGEIAGRNYGRGGDGHVGIVGSTENSLLDVVFLPELSVLLGLVGGRAEVQMFCCDTGLVLAILAGHTLPVSCIQWIPSQALVLGQDDEDDGRNNRNNESSSDGVASAGGTEPNQATSATTTISAEASTVTVSKESARGALRALKPEILRQAGVRPAWRTGRVTAVLDRSACSLNHPAAAMGPTPGSGIKTKMDPLIEVTYDDGAIELGVDPRHLRRPEEASPRADKGGGVVGPGELADPTSGPDWERQPVRPAVGVRVAVYGLCKARLCREVADMMGRVSDEDHAHDPSASTHGPHSPSPPTQREIFAVLKTIRGRAARAAAAAGDSSNSRSSISYNHGGSDVFNERDNGDVFSSAAALEAALEATDVSDENLRALADALAAEVKMADSMDEEQPWDPASAGNGGGFFYLSSSGEVLSIPSPSGFEERYVLLDDAAFFEVSGPLGAARDSGDGGEEVAARFRDIFRKRAGMLRIVYTSSVGPRSVEAICRQMNDTGVAARRRPVLDTHFPGQRFVVFYREGDGPERDISEAIHFSARDRSSRTGYAPTAAVTAHDTAAGGAVEFLRIEVCGGGGGGGVTRHFPAHGAVSLWAVGRVALRVEARSFDKNLGKDRQVAAGAAFMASWAFSMQHLRGLNSARMAASRSRANAEARFMARVSDGLRLCSLDRACGEEVADTVGTTALTQALAAALRLPSRFPRCGASSSWPADCYRLGADVQAAKVLRFLAATGTQTSEINIGGGKTGLTATLLLESLQQVAFYSPLDPIAWHFLRPVLTPAFQEALLGEAGQERRATGRTIEWNGLLAALDAAAVHPQHRATTEEAFTLLVRFGQAPPDGALLERFARNAGELRSRSLLATPARDGLRTTPVVGSVNRSEEPDASNGGSAKAALGPGQNEEASSVLLGASEVAALAVELDPMRRIDSAFASIAEVFRDDAVSIALVEPNAGGRHWERYRSPLHSYAIARRCRGWENKLETVGISLATTRRRLGRRGQDLLVVDAGLAANAETRCPASSLPAAEVSASELIAQAKAVAATATRRQQADEAGMGRGRGGSGSSHGSGAVLTARIHRYAPIPERSAREAVVVEDGRKGHHQGAASGRREDEFEPAVDGASMTHPRPIKIVCERLEGWRPLCEVVREHGPLVTPSDIAAGEGGEGLRVLRLWGGQLAAALECLASMSLVLRDLRVSTVFVSPDGSAVKVTGFLCLTTVGSEEGGIVSSEAPALDNCIHGPTKPLTPPEAITISRAFKNRKASNSDGSSVDGPQPDLPSEFSLVLAGTESPGEFPVTAKWDIWTLGILLFQLAFGHPPPAYGDCLRQGLSSLNPDIFAAAGRANAGPVPTIGDMMCAIHYDFLSAVGLQPTGGQPGEAFAATHVGSSPLENALECMSLGAAIGERDMFRVVSSVGERDAATAAPEVGGRNVGRKTVERFRRAWVRRQLQMEEMGEVDVMTWPAFQEKLRRHLDVSIAPATVATARPSCPQKAAPQGGGDEGGGRTRGNFVSHHDDATTAPASRKQKTRASAEAAVQRTASRLLAADPRRNGRIPFSVARGVVCDELQLTFSTREAKLLEVCLRDSGEREGSYGGDDDGRDVDDKRGGHGRREGERDVYYQPLVHVLHALSFPIGGPTSGSHRVSYAEHDSLPPPTPTAFVEILCACLEPVPDRRLSASNLLHLPFFSRCGIERGAFKNTDDLQAASGYIMGSGNELSPILAFRERVEYQIQALEASADGTPTIPKKENQEATASRTTRGVRCVSTNFGAGALVEALKELEHLVRRSSPAGNYLTEDDHPKQARRVARGHARVVDEIFQSAILMRVSALALRFLDREEAEAVGRGVSGVGFVEGDPSKTVGARVLLALARVLEVLLLDLRRPGSVVRPYVDVVLRCLVTLFLGEEGSLAVRYGHIGHPPAGRPSTATGNPSISWRGGRSRWRPAISQMFEGLLVEAVGETGEGGLSYPPIQRYTRRCGLATHRIGAGAACGRGSSENLDALWDAGGGGDEEEEHDGSRDEGGGHGLGETRRRRSGDKVGHDQTWESSSENDDSDIGGNARDGGLVRSHIVPLFVRAPTYFAELLALGRVLYAIDRSPGPQRTTSGVAGRARRQATSYCLTLVRLCCDVGSGGLDNAEPPNWMGGGRELDEEAATLQRAQLLVDARLGEKLAPCLNDPDPDVRRDAMGCALSALRGGHERLRWISLSVRETEEVDPRALLALNFCSMVWVSAFTGLLRGRGAPAVGQPNPTRPTREAEENARRMALRCLGYMAAAGDLATHSWRGARVLYALQGTLNRGGASVKDESITITAGGPGRRSSTTDDRIVRSAPDDFIGWNEGVLGVLQSLAENGSAEIHSMIRAQPGLGASFSDPELILNPESLLAPKGLASTAIELKTGAGTLGEIMALVRRTRSTLATAVRIGDQRVLGVDNANVPEDVEVTLSLVWGWMQRALVQLVRDGSDHPSAAARVSLAWESLALIRFLLGSPTACRLARCKIHPDVIIEVSRACGVDDDDDSSSSDRRRSQTATSDLAAARTGLETVVFLVSLESPAALDLYQAHPIPPLAVGAADALADSLTHGDRETVEALENYGLGLRLGLAVEASTRLVRESRRLGVEEVHLLQTYPDGRRARVKLLDRVLCQGGDRRGGRGLHEQVIVSGLLEFLLSNMLPDCTTTDVLSARLPASFVRHNGTPLVRNEGIALLERVVARRYGCPAVAREAARQAVRHEVSSAECSRLRENRRKSVRAGVSACLRCLARLDSPAVDRMLSLSGVPQRAMLSARRDHAASKTRRQWARWARYAATAASNMKGGTLQRASLLLSADPRGFGGGKSQTPARHARDLGDGTYHTHQTSPKHSPAMRAPAGTGGVATRDSQRPSSIVDETSPPDASGTGGTPRSPQVAKNDTPEREQSAVLTIEGPLSTLSVPGLLGLLAAELATTEDSITVVEVGVSSECSVDAVSRQSHAAADKALPTSVDRSSVLKILLPPPLASQLYTRCLAGVLRVPGLLYLEVEGKGKLTWNGEEIVSNGESPRQLLSEGPTAPSSPHGSRQPKSTRHSSSFVAASSDGSKTSLTGLKEAMVRAMTDLRLPLQTAKDFCKGAGGDGAAVTFSDFISRYADASGLSKEATSSDKKGSREIWVESSAGAWVAVSLKELKDAQRAFDEQVAKQEDQDQESKSMDEDFGVEKSLGKEDAIAALKRLRQDVLDGTEIENYFNDRGRVIDELYGARVSFQEFTRAILHLDPQALMSHDCDGTSSRSGAGDRASLPSTRRARSASPPGYFDGQPEGTAENKGNRRYDSGDEDESREGEDEAVISVSERERALRKAFEMYDLNGDGFVTYLELKAVFEQRGVHASATDIREWIKQRDTSGTGAVDFADFSRAFVFSSS
eukprot:g6178.t1